jgi:dTDP-glucose 4,6-dehydratase
MVARSLVTGGAGVIGSHFCERLLYEGHEVICLDNLITGTLANIQHLLEHPRFIFLQKDVSQEIDLNSILAGASTDRGCLAKRPNSLNYVLHLASPASPEHILRHPIDTMRAGSFGTYNALELARATNSVFLLASTSEVYGDPTVHPQVESYWGHVNPIGPRSVYDEAKRFAEALTMAYRRRWGLSIRIARIFNTYGENMRRDDGRVIPRFITQALGQQAVTVYGDGSQTRSFCYVGDTIEGLYRLLLSTEQEPVNLGNPDEVAILALAQEIIEMTKSKSPIIFEPFPVDDPVKRKPDISKAAAALGWHPSVSRKEGLMRVITSFGARLKPMAGAKC